MQILRERGVKCFIIKVDTINDIKTEVCSSFESAGKRTSDLCEFSGLNQQDAMRKNIFSTISRDGCMVGCFRNSHSIRYHFRNRLVVL